MATFEMTCKIYYFTVVFPQLVMVSDIAAHSASAQLDDVTRLCLKEGVESTGSV